MRDIFKNALISIAYTAIVDTVLLYKASIVCGISTCTIV